LLRATLVPITQRYPIAELIAASRRYVARTNRISFEYAMAGINDSPLARAGHLLQACCVMSI
jgi:23S rRNA (adenine2503-C2)-methyltransferase